MKSDSTKTASASEGIASIKYPAKRKNIAPAGIEVEGRIQETPKLRHEYNPHLPPVLRSAGVPPATERPRGQDARAPLDAAEADTFVGALRRLGKGEAKRVAVKVIDPRENEGLRVLTLKD